MAQLPLGSPDDREWKGLRGLMTAIIDGELRYTDLTKNSSGGTELMARRIHASVDPDLLKRVNIIFSRVDGVEYDESKPTILAVHDLAQDPQVGHLANDGWKRFTKIVFVSHQQQQMYRLIRGVPYSHGVVLKNAIEPIQEHTKPDDKIRLAYYSTPHRGLHLAYIAFKEMKKYFGDNIEFNVWSSFGLYGWEERDEQFTDLFKALQDEEGINYHKAISNEDLRTELEKQHVFVLPSIWEETSCLALIEAMSAGMLCVHSSLGALPETSMGITSMYDYTEDQQDHLNRLYRKLMASAMMMTNIDKNDSLVAHLNMQKTMADSVYDIRMRAIHWNEFLSRVLS